MAGRKQAPMKRESFLVIGDDPPICVQTMDRELWLKYREKLLEKAGKNLSDLYTYKLSQMMENQ